MVKSTKYDKSAPFVPFPKLMISESTGVIVLFKSPKIGTVVFSGTSKNVAGHYERNWLKDCFIDYTGSVTLSNM